MGMPLGNLTSQFFANVYLNELDHYVKEQLKAKYYIRYVDDFVILHKHKTSLEYYKYKIDKFLRTKLALELHPDKSKIINFSNGTNFLGLRIFPEFKLIRKKNLIKFEKNLLNLKDLYQKELVEREKVIEIFEGWIAYVSHADTYKYRRQITRKFNKYFPLELNIEIKNPKKHDNFQNKIETANYQFTTQKTLQSLKKGLNIQQTAEQRQIKESTVWSHIANLIEYNQVSIWKIFPKNKILKILPKIYSPEDKLKDIKERIRDNSITFDEINCVLANVKYENKKKTILRNINWYRQNHCLRKCFWNPEQREKCSKKFDLFISKNQSLEINKKEFLNLFNNHMKICILPEQEKLRSISHNEFRNIKNNK